MQNMIRTKVWLFALLILPFAGNALTLDLAKDPIAIALAQGDLQMANRAIRFDEEGSKIAAIFSAESKQSASDPVLRARFEKVGRAFDERLLREMNAGTFDAYRQLAADGNLNEQDRMRLIIPMVECATKLRPIQKDSLKDFFKGILASGASAPLKAGLLLQATRNSSIGLDGIALLPFCRSADTTIRRAAFHGLVYTIAHNRDLGKPALNRTVFDSIKDDGSRTPDAFQVLTLASIGEDYARDYLLLKCASDAGKLTAIIRHDPYLRHPGLVLAALAFPADTPEGAATRQALRYGLKEPAWVANQIASGAYADPVKADELRKVMTMQTTVSR